MGSSTVRRLAAAGTASGAVLVGSLASGAAPAWAAPATGSSAGAPLGTFAGVPTVSIAPQRFTPGENVTVLVRGCVDEPSLAGQNEAFVRGDPAHFDRAGGTSWTGIASTKPDLKPGNAYITKFRCRAAGGPRTLTLFVTVPEKSAPPAPPKAPPGKGPGGGFDFGFDDVDLSTRTVLPGGRLAMKVHCPARVSATSSSFVADPLFTETAEDTWEATARFERSLPSVVRVRISCAGHGHVVFTTRPGRDEVSPGPAIPRGAPETGDGSTATGRRADRTPLLGTPLLGTGAVAVTLAGAGLVLRRRAAKDAKERS
ncbi:hypothetical protein AB0J52_11335 [Spirillospora sp. NPDC049652]